MKTFLSPLSLALFFSVKLFGDSLSARRVTWTDCTDELAEVVREMLA